MLFNNVTTEKKSERDILFHILQTPEFPKADYSQVYHTEITF